MCILARKRNYSGRKLQGNCQTTIKDKVKNTLKEEYSNDSY